MRETRSSGSVEGVVSNHDPYSDRVLVRSALLCSAGPIQHWILEPPSGMP